MQLAIVEPPLDKDGASRPHGVPIGACVDKRPSALVDDHEVIAINLGDAASYGDDAIAAGKSSDRRGHSWRHLDGRTRERHCPSAAGGAEHQQAGGAQGQVTVPIEFH
jgi:hypothetical protein